MKVLLVSPPLREWDPPTDFPFGVSYVAKYLIQAGHDVQIIDIETNRYSRSDVEKKLEQCECDLIGTGGMITVYKYLKWLVPKFRKYHPSAKIVVGGSLATSAPELTLSGLGVDFVVVGEGERTAVELANVLEGNLNPADEDIRKVDGIGYNRDGKVVLTQPREPIENIDQIGFPPWDLFDVQKILANTAGIMTLLAERGCPYRCGYCYHQFGYKPRRRSLESIISEMIELKNRYGVSKFRFSDNLFIHKEESMRRFVELLRQNKLSIQFHALMRASVITDELVKLLKEAGCTRLSFGFESGSQKVLDLMNKMTTVQQMDDAVRIVRENDVDFDCTWIIGYPGENKEDIDETIAFCKRNDIIAKPFFATPYPGTPLFNQIKNQIDDMERFVSALGDVRDLVINMSELSSKELIAERRRVVEETEKEYLKKRKFLAFIFSPLRLLNIEVGFAVKIFEEKPFKIFLLQGFKVLRNYIRGTFSCPVNDDGYDKSWDKDSSTNVLQP